MSTYSPNAPHVPAVAPRSVETTCAWSCGDGGRDRAATAWRTVAGHRGSPWAESGATATGRRGLVAWTVTVTIVGESFQAVASTRLDPTREAWFLLLLNGVITIPLATAWKRWSERNARGEVDRLVRAFARATGAEHPPYR